MNHVNVEEVEEQPDAVIGKFLVKSFTALVLFDTGASHSYISRGFVGKYKLPTQALRSPMLVTSPGAEYVASLWCGRLPLRIGNYVFSLKPNCNGIPRIGCDIRHGLVIKVWREH